MGVWVPRTSQIPRNGALLLVCWIILCSGTEETSDLTSLIPSVYSVIDNKTALPFCFTTSMYDLTCFWESNTSDVSRYTFHYHTPSNVVASCELTVMPASNGTWWQICQFPEDHVEHLSIDPFVLCVNDSWTNQTLYERSFFTEKVVYIEPLKNVTVKEQINPLGLVISVKDPSLDPMTNVLHNMLIYQVNYSSRKSDLEKSVTFKSVDTEDGFVKLFLSDVTRGYVYRISVRAKADDLYSGYWSEWSVVTFSVYGFDELHIILYVVVGLIPVAVVIMVFICNIKFLKNKAWPTIPTPEHHFKELYTTHNWNFKLWLGQTDSYLMWFSRNIFHEGPISTVEVLSELPNAQPPQPPPTQLLPKDSYVILDENMLPHFSSWVVSQRQVERQREEASTADVPSQEKTLRKETRSKESDTMEAQRAEELVMVPNGVPECRGIVREDSMSSEEGKQSPGSSFEYTVLETYNGLLSPRTRSIPPRQPLKYVYLQMSDSGDEAPPPPSNFYQNSPCAQFLSPVYTQC